MTEKFKSLSQHGCLIPIIVLVLCTLMVMVDKQVEVFAPPAPSSQSPGQTLSAEISVSSQQITETSNTTYTLPPPSMSTADPPPQQGVPPSLGNERLGLKNDVNNIRVDD